MESVKAEVAGKYACFTRAEMNTHRVSYSMMTPPSARGILQAIYAKPNEFEWRILRLWLLQIPRTTSFTTNEVKSKINLQPKAGSPLYCGTRQDRLQRHNLILQNCRFGIEAIPIIKGPRSNSNNEQKHISVMTRRLRKGACFYRPYLGIRDYPAEFKLVDRFEPVDVTEDLGLMPLTVPYGDTEVAARMFEAKLVSGCMEVPNV